MRVYGYYPIQIVCYLYFLPVYSVKIFTTFQNNSKTKYCAMKGYCGLAVFHWWICIWNYKSKPTIQTAVRNVACTSSIFNEIIYCGQWSLPNGIISIIVCKTSWFILIQYRNCKVNRCSYPVRSEDKWGRYRYIGSTMFFFVILLYAVTRIGCSVLICYVCEKMFIHF